MADSNLMLCPVSDKMKQQFISDEPVILTVRIERIRGCNFKQRRTMVISGDAVYIFNNDKRSSCFEFSAMRAIIRSSASRQVVFVLPQGKDLHFQGVERGTLESLLTILKSRFINVVRNRTLEFYVVPQQNLREFSTDKRRHAFDSMPDESYRATSEEIPAINDENKYLSCVESKQSVETEEPDLINQIIEIKKVKQHNYKKKLLLCNGSEDGSDDADTIEEQKAHVQDLYRGTAILTIENKNDTSSQSIHEQDAAK